MTGVECEGGEVFAEGFNEEGGAEDDLLVGILF